MEYLPQSNRASLGEEVPDQITAAGKDVVIIGGGDTGADCLGTRSARGARRSRSWRSWRSPGDRPAEPAVADVPDDVPVSSAHEEAGDRVYAVSTQEFLGDDEGGVARCDWSRWTRRSSRSRAPSGRSRPELVLLAMGFTGPEQGGLVEQLGVDLDQRGTIARDASYASSVEGVFVAGDAGRGQSLIVWAIAEGRAAAAAVDRYLTGETSLPSPIPPTERPMVV
jgi:glutamate synthase (NADPH/NADH) small chain